jgi:hypothetical protein
MSGVTYGVALCVAEAMMRGWDGNASEVWDRNASEVWDRNAR